MFNIFKKKKLYRDVFISILAFRQTSNETIVETMLTPITGEGTIPWPSSYPDIKLLGKLILEDVIKEPVTSWLITSFTYISDPYKKHD